MTPARVTFFQQQKPPSSRQKMNLRAYPSARGPAGMNSPSRQVRWWATTTSGGGDACRRHPGSSITLAGGHTTTRCGPAYVISTPAPRVHAETLEPFHIYSLVGSGLTVSEVLRGGMAGWARLAAVHHVDTDASFGFPDLHAKIWLDLNWT